MMMEGTRLKWLLDMGSRLATIGGAGTWRSVTTYQGPRHTGGHPWAQGTDAGSLEEVPSTAPYSGVGRGAPCLGASPYA